MLGRLIAPDENDHKFLMKALLPEQPTERRVRYWNSSGEWCNQGLSAELNSCVGHAWKHWVEDGPVTHPGSAVDPVDIYREAKKIDEWEGEDYEGTSVRAGAKVLLRRGLIKSYNWAFTAAEAVKAVLTTGPVVLGTDWFEGMSNPDKKGRMTISGSLEGGHATVMNGVNLNTGYARIKNSWGRKWGFLGHAYLSIEELDELIRNFGEACLAVEKRLK